MEKKIRMCTEDMFVCLRAGIEQRYPDWGIRTIGRRVLALEVPEDEITEAVWCFSGASIVFSVPLAVVAVDTMIGAEEEELLNQLNRKQGLEAVVGISTLQAGSKSFLLIREIVLKDAFVILLVSTSTEEKKRRIDAFCDMLKETF